jgi:glyoxylase I family protein
MALTLDHIVLWVDDPLRSLAFFEKVVGLPGLRAEAFREGAAPFPSVRVSEHSIIDLMPRALAPMLGQMASRLGPSAETSAGHPVHHLCFAMSSTEFDALRQRLHESGVATGGDLVDSFGAGGLAPRTFYFCDPDGNVLEARHYDEAAT